MTAAEAGGDELTTETQQAPYVGLPTTDKLSVRETRFEVGKAHAEWVTAWHAHMYVLARQGSTFGEFSTTIRSFVDSYGGHVPDPRTDAHTAWRTLCLELWAAFERNGVVDIDGDPADSSKRFRVRVVDFAETNVPRPTRPRTSEDERRAKDAARKRKQRAAKKGDEPDSVTPAYPHNVRETSDTSADASADVHPNRSEDSEETDITGQSDQGAPEPSVDTTPAEGLTFNPQSRTPRRAIDDATSYEIERLLPLLRDADHGTIGVLEHLARQGAGPADFADAREAIKACSPLRPAAYAVRTIGNRLAEALKPPTPTIGATA